MGKAAPSPWRSRIVATGEEDPESLLANPRNWRTHPVRQREALRGSLSAVGWVQSVIVNRTTGHVVDGHARIEEAISAGARVPVVYVELSEEEEALVLATLDPIGAMATTDTTRLEELLSEVSTTEAGLAKLLAELRPPAGDQYTTAIEVPRYEPTGEQPALDELVDRTRENELRLAILEAADDGRIDQATETFLLLAAGRHVRFNYGRIAEFYAHAPADVQRLFEASALVIVDYEDAIRNGYVRFMEAIADLEAGDRDLQ